MATGSGAFIVDAVRTPFGRNGGGLAHLRTDDLAALPIRLLLARNSWLDPAAVEEVVLGNTNGAGEENRNLGRMAALLSGLPETVPGMTVNRLCASGAEALVQAFRAIAIGDADIVIAGGAEGMSRAPFVLEKPDAAFPREVRIHQTTVGWRMPNPQFPEDWTRPLGVCVERVAAELGIVRQEMDEYAARSHTLVASAYDRGFHDGFVAGVNDLMRDESVRPHSTVASLAKLPPAFGPGGTITAGNASPINDGAIAAIVASSAAVDEHGLEPLGRIVGSATVGVSPDRFATAPVGAIHRLLERNDLQFSDIRSWEINEAFAGVVLACSRLLPLVPEDRLNAHGGAIAMGHPLGASAARMVVDLCRDLRRRGGGLGVGAACIGVGLGQAILVEV